MISFAAERKSLALKCVACGEGGSKELVLTVDSESPPLELYRCGRCGSMLFQPAPHNAYDDKLVDAYFRHYVEVGAAIEIMAENLARVIEPESHGRMLEVGCSLGLALDFVRHGYGWEVAGTETGQMGRLGAVQLGLDIDHSLLAESRHHRPGYYNLIHAAEVIEHTDDPLGFLYELAESLAPEGVLVLTTPDARLVRPTTAEMLLTAILSPGYHSVLFTPDSLRKLLAEVGLSYVEIVQRGVSFLVYASRVPLVLRSTEDLGSVLVRYLTTRIRNLDPGSAFDIGFRFRLLRLLVNRGEYEQATSLINAMPSIDRSNLKAAPDLEQFAVHYPICAPSLLFYRGIWQLNYLRACRDAADSFELCFDIAAHMIRHFRAEASAQAPLLWPAKFHQALALRAGGETSAAMEAAEAVISNAKGKGYDGLIPVDLETADRAAALYAEMDQELGRAAPEEGERPRPHLGILTLARLTLRKHRALQAVYRICKRWGLGFR